MQSQQNQKVRQQLISQFKQLENHQTASNYYMAYDFPEKQKALKSFWEELIEKVMKLKNQIYVTFYDLEAITTIHKLKPTPLKKLLVQLKRESVYVREEDLIYDPIPKKVKPWYSNIMEFAWAKPNPPDFQWPFTFEAQQKIVGYKPKQRKKRQLIVYLQSMFNSDDHHAKLMKGIVRKISLHIKVDQPSVQIILKQMVRLKQVHIVDVKGLDDSVMIYHCERKKMLDDNFVKVETMKCMMNTQFQRLNAKYDKSSNNIVEYRQKAKNALLVNDKNKAKMLIAYAISQQKHREQIQVRMKAFQNRINYIQLNEINMTSVDFLDFAQKVCEQITVDTEKFDKVMQKQQDQKHQLDQMNMKFKELAESDDVEDEVDKLLAEIEKDTGLGMKKGKVEEKKVHVTIPEKEKDVQIDKPAYIPN